MKEIQNFHSITLILRVDTSEFDSQLIAINKALLYIELLLPISIHNKVAFFKLNVVGYFYCLYETFILDPNNGVWRTVFTE